MGSITKASHPPQFITPAPPPPLAPNRTTTLAPAITNIKHQLMPLQAQSTIPEATHSQSSRSNRSLPAHIIMHGIPISRHRLPLIPYTQHLILLFTVGGRLQGDTLPHPRISHPGDPMGTMTLLDNTTILHRYTMALVISLSHITVHIM
jgi:hypothetical protein